MGHQDEVTDDLDEDEHEADRLQAQTNAKESVALDLDEVEFDLRDEGGERCRVIRRPQVSRNVATRPAHVQVPLAAFARFYKQMGVFLKTATGTDTEDLDDFGGLDEVPTSRQARQLCGPKSPEAEPAGSQPQVLRVPKSLLRFPIELETLDGDHQVVHEKATQQERTRKHGRGYRWTSDDRKHLQEMKQKGWSVEQIGAQLGRSPMAIVQQWRKQEQPRS